MVFAVSLVPPPPIDIGTTPLYIAATMDTLCEAYNIQGANGLALKEKKALFSRFIGLPGQ